MESATGLRGRVWAAVVSAFARLERLPDCPASDTGSKSIHVAANGSCLFPPTALRKVLSNSQGFRDTTWGNLDAFLPAAVFESVCGFFCLVLEVPQSAAAVAGPCLSGAQNPTSNS